MKTVAKLCEEITSHIVEMNKVIAVMDGTDPKSPTYEMRVASLFTRNAAIAPLLREMRDLE